MTAVPFVDLRAQQAEIHAEIMPMISEVMASAAFMGGKPVAAFEQEYAEFVGSKHCIGVANGTDALEMALRALGVEAGAEVIVPANSFIATAEAVSRVGAVPKFVDADEATLLVDPALAMAAVDGNTAAILPVHLYGQMAAVEQLVSDTHHPLIIEDAAQSQGATRHGRGSGSVGIAAATSFYPGKNLGAGGDAGAVTTDNAELADRVRALGAHGGLKKYEHDIIGFNSRLDAVQAIVLSAKLSKLARWNDLRRAAADRYAALLGDIDGLQLPAVLDGNVPVWHLYVIRVPERDRVLEVLTDAGIGAGLHYPTPIHLTAAYRSLGHSTGDFPVSEKAAGEILSLPMYPHLTEADQQQVSDVLHGAL